MKMDLSKWKKVKEDAASTTLKHPDGHAIRIAHNGLSPAMREGFKKLPLHLEGGGEADPGEAIGGETPRQQPQTIINVNPAAPVPAGNQAPDRSYEAPPQAAQPTPTPAPGDVDQGAKDALRLPAVQGTSAQPQANAAAQPQASGIQPQGQPGFDPFGPFGAEMRAANNTGIAGQQNLARAQGELGQQQAQAQNAHQIQVYQMMQDFQHNTDELNQERQNFIADVQSQQIDPEHYWTNHSKVSTAIGLLLGGIAGGITGQENPAAKFLMQKMDQDLMAQKENLGSKKTLLEANLRQYGNMRDAMTATRIMQNDMLVSKMNELAGQNANPAAKAQAQINSVPYLQQNAQLTQQLALSRTLSGAQGGAGGKSSPEAMLQYLRIVAPEKAKEMEGRFVPGMGFGSIPLDQKSRDELSIRNELDQKLGRLEAFAHRHSGSLDPATMNQGRVMAQDAQDAYRRANGQGVFREAESKFVNNMVDQDPTKFFGSFRTMPGYKAIREGNRSALINKAQSFGLPTPQFQDAPQTATKNGKRYVRQGNYMVPVK